MKRKVIRAFFDKTDANKPYSKGDTYSHSDGDRISFLAEKGFLEQKSKQPPSPSEGEYPKHAGGGYYKLSNGEKVNGKKEAEKAQAELDGD
ncbi:hypothetical protein [Salibacterium lacus]|uniref:Uncharacterized protein n=1 Tax=Salibacterium lacus TaxID=1898109 RepID=A0ABW5T0G4_9BACI